ncbi:MAG: outer membrane beta-barrel family protein [Marinoscillum sp.]
MFRYLLVSVMLSTTVLVCGQSVITGQLIDASTQEPLSFATVSLINPEDGGLVTGGVSDMEGSFKVPADPGTYTVRIQFVTYKSEEIKVTLGSSPVNLGTVSLSPSNKELEEVVVQGERTQMQLNLDKKVYNVGKDLSNLGGSASDMLDNLPSVQVDVEGNVQLRGSSNVKILINGRPSGLVGLSSTDALKQLQSNLIESVEIITNPSARYDAEGQAGIINIILKKEEQKGLNGSFQASTGYPHNHGVGINMNFRKKWVNFFVNYGLNVERAPGTSYTNQQFFRDDSTFYTDQVYDRSRGGFSNNFRVGADFNVGENSTLTGSFLYRFSNDLNLNDLTMKDFDSNRELALYTLREDEEEELDKNQEYSLIYVRDFKKKDHKLTANIQYQDNYENEVSDITQNVGPTASNIDSTLYQNVDNVQGEERLMLQLDYVLPFGSKSKMEAGYRSTLRNVYNNYLVEESPNGETFTQLDTFTFDFLYKEYVHAFYGIVSDEMDKFSWQVGLRAEVSDIETDISGVEENKTYNYTNFFPSAFLTYKVKGMSQFQLSYSRRINRPRYRDLSPLSSFTNNRNFRVGNPALQPEYTDSYELGFLQNFENSSIYYGVYYRHTKDPIQRVNRPADENNIIISIEENLGLQKSLGFELNANQDFTEWYRLSGNFNFYRQETNGFAYDEDLYAETVTFSTRISNNLKFKDFIMAQVNLNYRAPQIESQGRREAITVLDIGLSKDLWEKKGTIALSARDVFNSRKYRGTTETSNYIAESEWQWRRGPQVVLTLNYRLNQSKREGKPEGREGYEGGGDDF